MPTHRKPKRRLKNFDFSEPDAHVALVDVAANGTSTLVMKKFSDMERFDFNAEEFVNLKESGLRINISLEDILLLFTDFFPEDIETLTQAIQKSESGTELLEALETQVKSSGIMPFDAFEARRAEFEDNLVALDKGAMEVLRSAAFVINEFLDRGIKPGDSDSTAPSNLVEKTEMTKEEQAAADAAVAKAALEKDTAAGTEGTQATPEVPESVQKSLDENTATIAKQAVEIAELRKREDERVTATFVAKAATYKSLGLPEVAEGEDAIASFAVAMKTLSIAAPEAFAQVEKVLDKALDTISKGAALEEVGGDGEPVATDNEAKIAKAAAALREADPLLTEEAAVTKALETNPALYDG